MYKVLLVSNQRLRRTALKKMIEKNQSFSVSAEAGTPKEAIDLIEEQNINLIFTDFIMSNMSGLDFVNKIENINREIMVFLLAFPSDLYSRENEKVNLNQFILKPITFEKINEKLMIYEKNHKKNYQKHFVLKMKESIRINDFNETYKYLTEYISRFNFYDTNADTKLQIKNDLRNLGIQLINLNSVVEDKILERKFPISDLIVSDSRFSDIWIFKIIEYYFKKKRIKSYPILEDVFCYIDKNIDKNISLSDVVNGCNISQGYLSRLFKSEYNMTVVNFIHMKKINLAKEYILLENKTVSDVAFNLGYNEYGYFSKVFKKYENITVEQFRKVR